MKRKFSLSRRMRESLSAHCDQLNSDDAVDPNEFFKPRYSNAKTNKKAIQLCQQVSCCLGLMLGDCDDPIVQSLMVIDVVPAPDSSRLLVFLAMDESLVEMDLEEVLSRANLQLPRLRSEVARGIHRKRTPMLTLQIVPQQHREEGGRHE